MCKPLTVDIVHCLTVASKEYFKKRARGVGGDNGLELCPMGWGLENRRRRNVGLGVYTAGAGASGAIPDTSILGGLLEFGKVPRELYFDNLPKRFAIFQISVVITAVYQH